MAELILFLLYFQEGDEMTVLLRVAMLLTAVIHVSALVTPEAIHNYCIVGAGPGGLQLGSLLSLAKRDYIIFERGNTSGISWFH